MSVHNLRTEKMQPGDVYVGRPNSRVRKGVEGSDGYFGNPWQISGSVSDDGGRRWVVRQFEPGARSRIAGDPEYRDRIAALHGKRLFCWCAPKLCHAEVLERLAAELSSDACSGACDGCGALVYPGDGHRNTEDWSLSLRETVDVTFCKTCLEGANDGE